jgi:hypothetical protein
LPCGFASSYPKSAHQKLLAPQSEDFSMDFGEGGRRRIEHTARTNLTKYAGKTALRLVQFGLEWLRNQLV